MHHVDDGHKVLIFSPRDIRQVLSITKTLGGQIINYHKLFRSHLVTNERPHRIIATGVPTLIRTWL